MNAYILGSGPSILTVYLGGPIYWDGEYALTAEREGTTEQGIIEEQRQGFETSIDNILPGREAIQFLGPPPDLSSEVWRAMGAWDVQRREDGVVIAVHPDRDLWRDLKPNGYLTHHSALEMELPAFTQAVTAANQARVATNGGRVGADPTFPMLVTDANQLRQYYTNVGAYAPGAPTPAQPPPPCGLAVPNQSANPGLMRDCHTLLAAKDKLAGIATLNWNTATAVASWDGVTTGGTPSRVTKVELSSESLNGTIPAALGSLFELTHLDLSANSLTGNIPTELGWLDNLEEIRLSGNTLTGCIPIALKDVATNDLGSLNLLYCQPPSPGASPPE